MGNFSMGMGIFHFPLRIFIINPVSAHTAALPPWHSQSAQSAGLLAQIFPMVGPLTPISWEPRGP